MHPDSYHSVRSDHHPKPNDDKVVYEDYDIKVFHNGSGEIFIESKSGMNSRAMMRITPRLGYLSITASNCNLLPNNINGLRAIDVVPKK